MKALLHIVRTTYLPVHGNVQIPILLGGGKDGSPEQHGFTSGWEMSKATCI